MPAVLVRELDTASNQYALPTAGKSKAEAIADAGLSKSAAYRCEELAGPRDEILQAAPPRTRSSALGSPPVGNRWGTGTRSSALSSEPVGNSWPLKRTQLPLCPQPHASPAAVLRDELHAGRFQGGADRG